MVIPLDLYILPANLYNGYSVRLWSGRAGFNTRSNHTRLNINIYNEGFVGSNAAVQISVMILIPVYIYIL